MTNLNRAKSIVIGMALGVLIFMALSSEAEACACGGPVGGGHPYYTAEELDAIHDGYAQRVYVSITETDGDIWLYVLDNTTKGKYKAMNVDANNVGGYYTSEELEVMHDNTRSMMITVQEIDGDSWSYLKDNATNGYFKAMN